MTRVPTAGTQAAARARRVLLLVLCLAVLGSACGGGGGDTPQRSVLRVLMADDWAPSEPIVDAIRDFERTHPGVRVQVRGVPFAQIPEIVGAAVDGGETTVDLAHWHAFAAGARELAEPLDDLWERELRAREFVPGAVDDVTWEATRFGVPLDVNALMLMANEDAVRAATDVDLDRPLRFADVERIARRVTAAGDTPRGMVVADSSWTTFGWIRANGGEVVRTGDDGRARVTLTDPATIEALDFLGRLVARGDAFPPGAGQSGQSSFDHFRSGSIALHVSGSWDSAALEETGRDWTLRVLPMPRGAGVDEPGTALGGSSLFIPRGSPHRELAFELATHLIRDEYAMRYATEEGRLPARQHLYERPFFQTPPYPTVVEQLQTAAPMRLIAFPAAQRAFRQAIQEVLSGRSRARPALERAQREATRSLGRPR